MFCNVLHVVHSTLNQRGHLGTMVERRTLTKVEAQKGVTKREQPEGQARTSKTFVLTNHSFE